MGTSNLPVLQKDKTIHVMVLVVVLLTTIVWKEHFKLKIQFNAEENMLMTYFDFFHEFVFVHLLQRQWNNIEEYW